jgi:hypothetical protein
MSEYTCVKRNKTYQNRKLVIYSGKKKICNVTPWMGWCSYDYYITGISQDLEKHLEIRKVVMENLYWLLGRDCEKEVWDETINDWDRGRGIYGIPCTNQSQFHSDEEKNIAIESYYN